MNIKNATIEEIVKEVESRYDFYGHKIYTKDELKHEILSRFKKLTREIDILNGTYKGIDDFAKKCMKNISYADEKITQLKETIKELKSKLTLYEKAKEPK